MAQTVFGPSAQFLCLQSSFWVFGPVLGPKAPGGGLTHEQTNTQTDKYFISIY